MVAPNYGNINTEEDAEILYCHQVLRCETGEEGGQCFHSSSRQSQAGNDLMTAPLLAHVTQETAQVNPACPTLYDLEQATINAARQDKRQAIVIFLYPPLPNDCKRHSSGERTQGTESQSTRCLETKQGNKTLGPGYASST